jgi:hypothetical protein
MLADGQLMVRFPQLGVRGNAVDHESGGPANYRLGEHA